MARTLTLDERHYQTVADKARALGKTPEQYVQALIDADARTFDEILKPVREGFDSTNDRELDALFIRARSAARHPE